MAGFSDGCLGSNSFIAQYILPFAEDWVPRNVPEDTLGHRLAGKLFFRGVRPPADHTYHVRVLEICIRNAGSRMYCISVPPPP